MSKRAGIKEADDGSGAGRRDGSVRREATYDDPPVAESATAAFSIRFRSSLHLKPCRHTARNDSSRPAHIQRVQEIFAEEIATQRAKIVKISLIDSLFFVVSAKCQIVCDQKTKI
jgi:hypothetical protein